MIIAAVSVIFVYKVEDFAGYAPLFGMLMFVLGVSAIFTLRAFVTRVQVKKACEQKIKPLVSIKAVRKSFVNFVATNFKYTFDESDSILGESHHDRCRWWMDFLGLKGEYNATMFKMFMQR